MDKKPRYFLVDITDAGKDLDDEQAILAAAGLHKNGIADLRAVVANLEPALERARLVKGTLNQVNLPHVPVGVGTDCFKGGENLKHETGAPYLAHESELWLDGHALLEKVCRDFLHIPEKLTVICNSGLTDAAKLVMDEPELVKETIGHFVIMGGVTDDVFGNVEFREAPDGEDYLIPDDAANNAFDWPAALYLYQKLQEMGIEVTIVMREAAYGAQFPFSTYNRFADTGNPVGQCLLNRQQPSINALWRAAHAPEGSAIRGKLPVSRDRQWFVDVFCGGVDPGVSGEEDVWDFVQGYNQYDAFAVLAAIPEIRDRFFDSINVVINDQTYRIIGLNKDRNGVKDADSLREFTVGLQIDALSV